MAKVISGIQQVGIGVPDEHSAWQWYRQKFGMDIPIFQEAAEAPLMTRYTGNKIQSRSATLAINMQGGGGFEIWQFTSRQTQPPEFNIKLGDLGIYSCRIKSKSVNKTYNRLLNSGADIQSDIKHDPAGAPHFFVKDPYGNLFQVVEGERFFGRGKYETGGQAGCMIGVSDIEKARELYSGILEYDTVIYDESGEFDDLQDLNGGNEQVRRVLLEHSAPRKGTFSRLLGPSKIELVSTYERKPNKIFGNRYWGDQGFIHLCFDIRNMKELQKECEAKGFPFTVNSENSFDMGEAAGHFTYLEDPDGTLIEFVETHRIPIIKKLGWYLNLKNKHPEKPLPNWVLKSLRFNRVKN